MTETQISDWRSLRSHPTPQWFRDAKFGIYTHWGVYAVPAAGPNATWYPYNMYREGTEQYAHHLRTYGPPSEFGYKDFIPGLTGARFDADEWAEVFRDAGAQFAGPVGEHHDGFAMWDSRHTEWNAVRMGPHRDVVGELEQAIRRQSMRFMVAMHHIENWWFFPHWIPEYDTSDPQFAGLYGPAHNLEWTRSKPSMDSRDKEWDASDRPSKQFLDTWLAKTCEVIDLYQPDLLWFDFGLARVQEDYKREMLAYYYAKEQEWGRQVAVTYKWHNLVPGSGVVDLELGRYDSLSHHDWITDTTVDDGCGWGYLQETGYKSATTLIHYLVDNVSKNGNMLLNVGPKPNGEIPGQARKILAAMGRWLRLNGEAIYGTTPWMIYGEGPTKMPRAGYFMENDEVSYTAQDIRFTAKDGTLYAICLGWPDRTITIGSLASLYEEEIRSVELLGAEGPLAWSLRHDGLTVVLPPERPCEHAYVIKISRGRPFPG